MRKKFVLSRYEKRPYEYIFKHYELANILKDVEKVHIYGFSFSPVDADYLDCFYRYIPKEALWEVSWYSDTDIERIDKFVLNYCDVKDRLKLIQLSDIEVEKK